MNVEYSIIICSYNPDQRLLSQCLQAVARLNDDGLSREVLLVDNNSQPPLATLEDVRQVPFPLTVIREEKQGLIHARLAGIQQAKGAFLVFFDDDNAPQPDYLQSLHRLRQEHAQVGAWGPGKVSVQFLDGVAAELKAYASGVFQERNASHTAYACIRSWQSCYPFGTGLAIAAEHAREYARLVKAGRLNLSGRNGRLLTSGDDTQLVLCAIAAEAAAGISPGLKVAHLIPGSRTSYAYLKKLAFGSHACYDISIRQVLPEHPVHFGKPVGSNPAMNWKVIRRYLKTILSGNKVKTLHFIEYLGLLSSSYTALNRPAPRAIDVILGFLKVNVRR